jgi:hypothetical protein
LAGVVDHISEEVPLFQSPPFPALQA